MKYSNHKILVVIPYIAEDKSMATRMAKLHKDLAGVECEVITAHDENKIGWVNMHNKNAMRNEFDFYCYSCADYEPGEDYLLLAIFIILHIFMFN